MGLLTAWGGTALYDATVRAVDLVGRSPGRKGVILFSDGDDRHSLTPPEAAAARVQSGNAMLYSIGFGSGASVPALRARLEQYAQSTGGRAFYPRHTEELGAVFGDVIAELSNQYVLSYVSSNAQVRRCLANHPGARAQGQVRRSRAARLPGSQGPRGWKGDAMNKVCIPRRGGPSLLDAHSVSAAGAARAAALSHGYRAGDSRRHGARPPGQAPARPGRAGLRRVRRRRAAPCGLRRVRGLDAWPGATVRSGTGHRSARTRVPAGGVRSSSLSIRTRSSPAAPVRSPPPRPGCSGGSHRETGRVWS